MNQLKKLLELLLVLGMVCALLTGCSMKRTVPQPKPEATPVSSEMPETVEEGDTSAEPETDAPTEEDASAETETETPDEEEVTPVAEYPYDYTQKMDVTGVDFSALSALSNENIPYGFSKTDRDDQNRPNGVLWYDNQLSQYGAYTHIDTDEKVVYLTMDEGYETGCTPTILSTLKDKGVKATFFVTKQFYDEHPEYIQQMIDEGHIVGNHTCSHPAGGIPQKGAKFMYEDVKQLNDLVYDTFGYQMRVFRYPEGMSSKQSMSLLNQMGYKTIFWSFAYRDWVLDDQMSESDALKECMQYIHPGAIYLLHAESTTNTAILDDFIDSARAQGYEFGVLPVFD